MSGLLLRRLLQTPLIVLAVYTITFLLAWALPGSAVISDEGRQPPAAVLEAMEAQYNLDNQWVFYWQYLSDATGASWLGTKLSGGTWPAERPMLDFGPSLRHADWRVNEIIVGTLPVSVALGLSAITIALVVGVAVGVIGALKPNSWIDITTLSIALVGISLPSFLTGTALLLLFPVLLGVGRVAGWGTVGDMVLPALTLSLPFAAYIARLTRMGMIDVLGADYIRTARAKGLPERVVILRHALKNAFLPVLSYLGPATAFAMTGSFVIEMVFNVPGIGQHFVSAVLTKDLFLIMGIVLIYSTMLVLLNLIVDLLYGWVDPRIGAGSG
ncbi:MAG: ABC transporter permease [Phycisphaeraceae bacterium]|nr:MAG: ABC transporter permease [Phycisphaeraceae bacterium]